MEQTHAEHKNVLSIEVVSSKILKHYMLYIVLFFCQHCVCIVYETKSGCWRTLTVLVMVIVCQSLGGAALRGIVCVCVCAHISRKG